MRKRKNAGKGFGMMFHGAFSSKADAKRKERKVHGFIQPRNIKGERRFVVMSERKNPRRRTNLFGFGERERKPKFFGPKQGDLVKVDFSRGGEHETIWVRVTGKRGPRYTGILDNQPVVIQGRLGSPVSFAKKQIVGRWNPEGNPAKFMYAATDGTGVRKTDWGRDADYATRYAKTYGGKLLEMNVDSGAERTVKDYGRKRKKLTDTRDIYGFYAKNPAETHSGHRDWMGEIVSRLVAVYQSWRHSGYSKQQAVEQTLASTTAGPGAIAEFKKRIASENPSELVVLGANPHGATEEIVLEPHRTYTLRTNPSAEALREDFTGAPADGYTTYNVAGMEPGEYAQLGELLSLYVKPRIGGQVREIRFNDPRPLLVSDTSRRQLYFVEGDQDISARLELFTSEPYAGRVELGEVRRIDYKQRKEHVPNPEIDEWKHAFGEESGAKPTLWFDRGSRRLELEGGEYEVRQEGIVN